MVYPQKTLTAKELNMEKENNVVKGWTAYREFDQSWCYDVDGKIEWHKESLKMEHCIFMEMDAQFLKQHLQEQKYIFMHNG